MLMSPNDLKQLTNEVESLQVLNYEMMDALRSKIVWLIKYCEQNNIVIPDIKDIFGLIDKSGKLLEMR